MISGKGVDAVGRVGFAIEQRLDVGEHHALLVQHVLAYFARILVVEAQNQ